jgi:hypothetical protein
MRLRLVCTVALLDLALAGIKPTSAQTLIVRPDTRAEVLAVMFRLAGAAEYQRGRIQPYVHQIDSAFSPYAHDSAIEDIRRLRSLYGVGFDAVVSLAAHITDPLSFRERVPFDAPGCTLDPRWHGAAVRPFLADAHQFARDAHVASFLHMEEPLYDSAAARMRRVVDRGLDVAWFRRFYGDRSPGVFVVSPLVADADELYGATFGDGHRVERHAYVGIGEEDRAGFPVISPNYLPYIVHEFSHTFVNSVLDDRSAQFHPYTARVFALVEKQMRAHHYVDPQSMLDESVVRASVIRYLMAHGYADAAKREIATQHKQGFFWIEDLVRLLGRYEARRGRYPTFRSFAPEIVRYYRTLSTQREPASSSERSEPARSDS